MLTQRLKNFSAQTPKENDAYVNSLIDAILSEPDSCHEVWFSTAFGYPTLEAHAQYAAECARLAVAFRKAGIRVSMQVNNTIGHGAFVTKSVDCSGLVNDSLTLDNLTAPDGTSSPYSFCWWDKTFIDYNCRMVKPYVSLLKPERVWVDDDLRATGHKPVRFGCFCDHCIDRFNQKYGHSYSREDLVHEINRGDVRVRAEWAEWIRQGLYQFTYALTSAIKEASPETTMGLQNGPNGCYSGYGYGHLFRAMYDASGHTVGFRPGAGAYADNNPLEFLVKARCLEWQCASMPHEIVDDIRPEIECLPDVAYSKSAAGIAFETDTYFAYGATAMSYAMLCRQHEPISYHKKELSLFSKHSDYWHRLSACNAKSTSSGAELFVSKNAYLRPMADTEEDFAYRNDSYDFYKNQDLYPTLGIPLAYRSGDRKRVYYLTKENAAALTDADVEDLLGLPVLAEGEAVLHLIQRGFDRFGVRCALVDTATLNEEFLPCIINEGIHVPLWSESYYHASGIAFLPKKGSDSLFMPISRYLGSHRLRQPDFPENQEAPFGFAAFATITDRGGRWAIFGNSPFTFRMSLGRRNQIFAAMDWASEGQSLKALLLDPQKAVVLPRVNDEDRVCTVSLINVTPGDSGETTLMIRHPKTDRFGFQSGEEKVENLSFTTREGRYHEIEYLVKVPNLPGWSVGTVFCE